MFLSLDQSTSATKALLFAPDGRLIDKESRDHRQIYPQPGWVEHDAEEIWQNTLATLRILLSRRTPDEIASLACLSITNQRETILVFDRATGRPLHNALVWQCRRGDPLCAEQIATSPDRAATIHARTGLRIDSYFSAPKLQWLVRNRTDIAQKLADGTALIGTIDTYLIYRLTNGAVFATDHTNASRTLLYDIRRLAWDAELCGWWQVPTHALPEIRDCSAHFGEVAPDILRSLFAPTAASLTPRPSTLTALRLPICGVMGDSQAALFAQGCYEPGSAKATFGTGTSLLLNTGETPRFAQDGVVTSLAWVLNGQPTYALEGIIISSAATLNWLRDQLGLVADMRELDRIAAEVPDTSGVHLVPAFSGLGLPYWQPNARAAITGLSAHSDRRHIARAALESIALQVCDALEALRSKAGVPLGRLQADGGVTNNRLVMQHTADLCGIELRASSMNDCSPLGATLAGMLGTGHVANIAALEKLPRHATNYTPTMPRETATKVHAAWRAAVRQTLPAHSPNGTHAL